MPRSQGVPLVRSLLRRLSSWWSPRGPVPPAAPPIGGIASDVYARRFGAVWRPTHAAETVDWPTPRTHPGGPGTPAAVDFGALLPRHIPALGVLRLEGARLFQPEGWILGAEGLVLADHTWFSGDFKEDAGDEGRLEGMIRRELRRVEETPLPGTTLSLLSDFAQGNYGHFLLDALGRLALVEAAGIDPGSVDRILVPRPGSKSAARILAAMDLPAEKLVLVDAQPRRVFVTERLVAPTFPGAPRCYRPFSAAFLRRRVLRGVPPAPPTTRIYVDRTGPRRRLENRDDVLTVMEKHGFRIYDPSDHDDPCFDFTRARVIVGAHGAGLTDIVFAAPGARLLELLPTDHVYPYYFTLALAAGIDHSLLPCLSAEQRPPGTFGPSPFPFRADIDALRGALAAIGCA